MTTTTLFGLALAPLYAAIAQVESDNGKTSDNIYQLRVLYVHDCNRITNGKYDFRERDRYVRWMSERMMYEYWKFYGGMYESIVGKMPTYEVLARIHNGGPDGWKKADTVPYWWKVKKVMEVISND